MQKFVIFSLARTGSTLLAQLLNNHAAIHCDGELFNPEHWQRQNSAWLLPTVQKYPIRYIQLSSMRAKYYHHAHSYGFKLKPNQLKATAPVLAALHNSGWQILYLKRLSLFAPLISALVAKQTKHYHQRVNEAAPHFTPFAIDPHAFRQALALRQTMLHNCETLMARLPHLPLVYEDDLQSACTWDVTVARICAYLDLAPPPTLVTATLQKTWQRPYCELVSNYAELQAIATQARLP